MVRLMGRDKVEKVGMVEAGEVLMEQNDVHISHMHADHHLGLINIMQPSSPRKGR